MKEKFIRALLDACETVDEIDEVFDIAQENDIQKRCDFLIEKGVKYFDLPKDPEGLYEILKIMYVNVNSRFGRKRRAAKELLNIIL